MTNSKEIFYKIKIYLIIKIDHVNDLPLYPAALGILAGVFTQPLPCDVCIAEAFHFDVRKEIVVLVFGDNFIYASAAIVGASEKLSHTVGA